VLGLPVYREFTGGIVFFLGGGYLELSGHSGHQATDTIALWLQVRDLAATHADLAGQDVPILQPPRREPWGLDEMWIADPDGVRIVVVEVPGDHPLRRDQR
jgi:hypothetical protein